MKLVIERLGHLGHGIAAGPVFVPGALPGEEVEGALTGSPGAQRLEAPRILRPSPDRVAAPCPHYRSCGGCALMHASDRFVEGWKADVVRSALAAQGLAAPLRPVVTSPPATRRRATLAGRRTKKGALVGFHARASEMVVAIPNCRLLHPDLMAILPALEEVTRLGASRKTGLDLAVTCSLGGVDLSVSGAKQAEQSLIAPLAALAESWGFARITWEGEPLVLRENPGVRFGQAVVVPPPGAFLQATAEGEEALAAAVNEATDGARRIADLFAGCGTFSLRLAERAEVHAVEGEAAMLSALDGGWRQTERLRRVTTEVRDLFNRPLLPDDLARFDAAVIDPPRAGGEAQSRQLANSGLARIAAVSCNPVSFARDARLLVDAGFRLDWVQVVDQFRWSPHIELVAALSR